MGRVDKLSWASLFREPYRMNTHALPNKLGRVVRCRCLPSFRLGDGRVSLCRGNPYHGGARRHNKRLKGKQ